jgi:3-(3-hydroxy-phenyl)propionate hydroxylase
MRTEHESSVAGSEKHVLVVGAGPIGMTMALELSRHGIPSRVIEQNLELKGVGSRGIVLHQTALQVFEKLGASEIIERALIPSGRRTFLSDEELFSAEFSRSDDGALPTFANLQQYHTERILLETIDRQHHEYTRVLWGHTLTGLEQTEQGISAYVTTPNGEVRFDTPYIVACDGCRSPTRKMLSLDFPGYTDNSSFLIVDVEADLPHPKEHRFTFAPTLGHGQTQLIVPQPDGHWRLDWQLFPDQEPDQEMLPELMKQRVRETIGNDVPFNILWQSCYRFHQRMMQSFRHDRVFFAGDSAHLVAPFGARGMNSGIQDAENLAWKLAAVLQGKASASLLETYDHERIAAQKENQAITSASMRFISPNAGKERKQRDDILHKSKSCSDHRKLVDSGKMFTPSRYSTSPLITGHHPIAGSKVPDVRLQRKNGTYSYLRHHMGINNLVIAFSNGATIPSTLGSTPIMVVRESGDSARESIIDDGSIKTVFQASPGDCIVIRPDGHVGAVCTWKEVPNALDVVSGTNLN